MVELEKQKMKKYTFRNYISYLKDNPEGYWFKRRLYGWGWVPATKEGWFVVFIFIVFVLLNGIWFGIKSETEVPSLKDWILFFGSLIVGVAILIWICFKKGEKPKWTWGVIKK